MSKRLKAVLVVLAVVALLLPALSAGAHSRDDRCGRVCQILKAWAALQQAVNLSDGLVAYWTLDEASGTRADSIGDNDLLLAVPGYLVGSEAGVIGDAAQFTSLFTSQNSTLLEAADDAALRFADGPWTLSFWARHNGVDNTTFVYKGGEIIVAAYPPDELFEVRLLDGDPGGATVASVQFMFAEFPGEGYHHYSIWYDGTTLSAQVDGGGVKAGNGSGMTASAQPLWVGWHMAYSPHRPVAAVDELGKWDRVLTAAERAALYNGGRGARP